MGSAFDDAVATAILPLSGEMPSQPGGSRLLAGPSGADPLGHAISGEMFQAPAPGSVPGSASDPRIVDLLRQYSLRAQDSGRLPPAGTLPSPVLHLAASVHGAILVDLPRSRLYVLDNTDGHLRVLREYYASIAKNGFGKRTAGDLRTPVGIYYATGFTPGSTLPSMYGAGAFPVNYPNVWDRRRGYTGSGIWLHGVPHDIYMRPPLDSQGCVVLSNDDLLSLKVVLSPRETPVVLADHVDWLPASKVLSDSEDLRARIETWRRRWSSLDTDGYLSFYASDFRTADGVTRASFVEHKRKVNASKARIEVTVSDLSLFRYPGEQSLVMAEFTQEYRSSNFSTTSHKEQFWRREGNGAWQIVLEAER